MVAVSHCDFGISESEDVSKLNLFWILTSLVQYNSLLKCLVGCSPLVRELRTRVSGIERKVHDWRKLAEISEEKTGATSKHLLGVVREGLAKTSVYLAKGLPTIVISLIIRYFTSEKACCSFVSISPSRSLNSPLVGRLRREWRVCPSTLKVATPV